MMRAVLAMLVALPLSGCFLDGAGAAQPDGAAPIDAFVPPMLDGGRRDAFVPPMDAGPRDAGSRDAGRDTGVVEMVDAFVPPDVGPPDAGTDAGPPDGGPPSCETLYGNADYIECDERGDQCEFHMDLGGSTRNCGDYCRSRGGDPITGLCYQNAVAGCVRQTGAPRSCEDDHDDEICTCTRFHPP